MHFNDIFGLEKALKQGLEGRQPVQDIKPLRYKHISAIPTLLHLAGGGGGAEIGHKNELPLMVGRVKTLQPEQFFVDDFQLRVEELGLLRIWRDSFQLFDNLLFDPQVLVMNGVQILMHVLETHVQFNFAYSL